MLTRTGFYGKNPAPSRERVRSFQIQLAQTMKVLLTGGVIVSPEGWTAAVVSDEFYIFSPPDAITGRSFTF